jgi:hypothetical protein
MVGTVTGPACRVVVDAARGCQPPRTPKASTKLAALEPGRLFQSPLPQHRPHHPSIASEAQTTPRRELKLNPPPSTNQPTSPIPTHSPAFYFRKFLFYPFPETPSPIPGQPERPRSRFERPRVASLGDRPLGTTLGGKQRGTAGSLPQSPPSLCVLISRSSALLPFFIFLFLPTSTYLPSYSLSNVASLT